MAPKKLLLTGVTGYVGGDVFDAVYSAHPELEHTVIVRSAERADQVRAKYPSDKNLSVVYGTTASYLTVLEDEARTADIIIHTAESADHLPSAEAILRGIRAAKGRSVENPVYWIHLSGTGMLQWHDMLTGRFGEPPVATEVYDDVASVMRLLTMPDEALHRNVDKVVQSAAHYAGHVRTAIVAPPTIYGVGRGPVNTVSQQLPALARFVLERGFAPSVGAAGLAEWDNVHISDVAALFLALVQAALNPIQGHDEELFGPRAYYFCETGHPHVWSKVAVAIAQEAVRQGYLKEAVAKTVTSEDLGNPLSQSWGLNSRSVATRARQFLNWSPKGPSLEDEIPGLVEHEAKKLGVKKVAEVAST